VPEVAVQLMCPAHEWLPEQVVSQVVALQVIVWGHEWSPVQTRSQLVPPQLTGLWQL
jgi:hypothetical protein